jgi:hypothetical protein
LGNGVVEKIQGIYGVRQIREERREELSIYSVSIKVGKYAP